MPNPSDNEFSNPLLDEDEEEYYVTNKPAPTTPKPQSNDFGLGYSASRGGLPIPNLPTPTPPEPQAPARATPPTRTQPSTQIPAFAPIEDDAFETIPADEVSYIDPIDDDFDDVPNLNDLPAPTSPVVQETRQDYEVRQPRSHRQPEPVKEFDEFINEETKTLLPFGGHKSKKSADGLAESFDNRENRRTKAAAIQYSILVALVGIVGFGAYNAINPPAGVSPAQMNGAIASVKQGQDILKDRGGSLAEDFMESYLTLDDDQNKADILASYYAGTVADNTTDGNTPIITDFTQTLLTKPKVYESSVTFPTATYTVGALVRIESTGVVDPTAPDTSSGDTEEAGKEAVRWVFYNINVYYDEKTKSVAITPDSPVRVPNLIVNSSGSIPDPAPIGNGEKVSNDIQTALKGPISSFLEDMAKSSATNHNSLDAHLIKGAKSGPDLIKGFNNQVVLANGQDGSITSIIYGGNVANEYKADVTVAWKENTADATAEDKFSGRYIITFQKVGSQYLVTKFAPYLYVPGPDKK